MVSGPPRLAGKVRSSQRPSGGPPSHPPALGQPVAVVKGAGRRWRANWDAGLRMASGRAPGPSSGDSVSRTGWNLPAAAPPTTAARGLPGESPMACRKVPLKGPPCPYGAKAGGGGVRGGASTLTGVRPGAAPSLLPEAFSESWTDSYLRSDYLTLPYGKNLYFFFFFKSLFLTYITPEGKNIQSN